MRTASALTPQAVAAVGEQARIRVPRWFGRSRLIEHDDIGEALCWKISGFSLDATVRIAAQDRPGWERLLPCPPGAAPPSGRPDRSARTRDPRRPLGEARARTLVPSPSAMPCLIRHLDLDAFYAAIEQRDHPEWRGRPVTLPKGILTPDEAGLLMRALALSQGGESVPDSLLRDLAADIARFVAETA